jgi:hypothetical protein
MSADVQSAVAGQARQTSYKLGPLGAEPALSETLQMAQQSVHRYAEEVMRPIGIKLDRMSPEDAADSRQS